MHGSSVGTMTRLRAYFNARQILAYIFSETSRTLGAHTSFCCGGTAVEGPGHEVDQPPPSSIEVKNKRSHTSTPPSSLHRINTDNLIFILFLIFLSGTWFLNTNSVPLKFVRLNLKNSHHLYVCNWWLTINISRTIAM